MSTQTSALARVTRRRYFPRVMRLAIQRVRRQLRHFSESMRLAQQYRRELAMLMQADDRMLMDIGVTRADMNAMAKGYGWIGRNRIIQTVSARRAAATQAAFARRQAIPQVDAPSLALKATHSVMNVSNFR